MTDFIIDLICQTIEVGSSIAFISGDMSTMLQGKMKASQGLKRGIFIGRTHLKKDGRKERNGIRIELTESKLTTTEKKPKTLAGTTFGEKTDLHSIYCSQILVYSLYYQ